jgi:cyclophilin family peptidyl-prolyl cis-trans isomerase
MAILKTTVGDIHVRLDTSEAPITTANFIQYARSGHYDGTIFHRVIQGFMIQGGGMNAAMQEKKTLAPIKNESTNGKSNRKYTIAMARTNIPDSATSQFFINTNDNLFLDRSRASDGVGYAVFGEVIAGMDVVDKIEGVKTGSRGRHDDVPLQAIEILSVELEPEEV